ncbi:MAG: hypothetical protein AAGJ40_19190 [Planctomycetota bacterium]
MLPKFPFPQARRNHAAFTGAVAWTAFGRLLHGAALWMLPIVLLRVRGSSEAGEFALAFAIVTPLVVSFRLNLRQVLATDSIQEYRASDYFICTAVLMAAAITCANRITSLSSSSQLGVLVLSTSLFLAVDSFNELTYGIFQRAYRMDLVGRSLAGRGLLSVATTLTLLGTGASTSVILNGLAVVAAGALSIDASHARQLLRTGAPPRHAGVPPIGEGRCRFPALPIFFSGFPLGITVYVMLLSEHATRYVVELLVGTEALGVFATLLGVFAIGNVFCSSVAQSILPRLSQYFAEGRGDNYVRLVLQAASVCLFVGVVSIFVAWILGSVLLRWLLGPEGREHLPLLVVLAIAGAATYTCQILGTAVVAMRRFWLPLPVNLLSLFATVLTAWWLVPTYGLVGAAWTQVLSVGIRLGLYAALIVSIPPSHSPHGGP